MVEPFPYFRWSVWRIGYESADHLTPLPGQWTGRGELPSILIYRCLVLMFLYFLFSFLSPSQGSYSGWKSAFPGPLLSCRDVRYLSDTKLVWVGWHPPTHPLVKVFHFLCVKIYLELTKLADTHPPENSFFFPFKTYLGLIHFHIHKMPRDFWPGTSTRR